MVKKTKKKRILVRGEYTYNSDLGQYKSLTKSGALMSSMNPPVMPKSNTLKQEKKDDVNNLLNKHYGNEWRANEDLFFYKFIIDGASTVCEEHEPTCEPIEEVNYENV